MPGFNRPAVGWQLGGAVLVASLCVVTAASAQAPNAAPSGFICLSNNCIKQPPATAPARVAPRPAAQPILTAPPAPGGVVTPEAQASLSSRILDSLSDAERATAQVSQTVNGSVVTTSVEFQNDNGARGRRTITVDMNPRSNPR